MDTRYRYGYRPGRRRRTRVLIVMVVSLLILGAIGAYIAYDLLHNQAKPVSSTGRTVVQALDENVDKLSVDESTFTMELPSDWKEVERKKDRYNNYVTWQASKKNAANRFLTVYVDIIPATKSVNHLLPVSTTGNGLTATEISENCSSFTKGGTLAAGLAQHLPETPAKYQSIDFICDLPRVNDNEVGTGSKEGMNAVTVKGAKGEHKYFFLFTDHNIQADYSIFYNTIRSFKAK